MTRNPLGEAEENNPDGVGALTDAEVAQFTATVEYLRSVIVAAFGVEWTDPVFSGDGYVVTEFPRSGGGYFTGYRGVRKTARGYAVMWGDERGYEGGSVTFGRFEDAVKGYAAGVLDSFRTWRSGRYLGSVAWMWNGTIGPGVVAHLLGRSNTQFRYFLEDDPSAWLEGDRVVATLSHGLGMSIAAFIAVIVAHPKVTAEDATAWPKPVRP
ncbi:hypothetical protein CH272_10115 [Rhodococcus sp. 05-340-1]|uniref:hypothetical protein n=1 Tax=unclassified Rhodococcus (in: high G+C Gram-positive bacteria) TaxID=192944 RepID=UPI000B9BF081|nr:MULTISPECIES: hypothetical protein [unclassified Rhodococcus (in: high G+C Gram-positive bacteria)]OZD69024.1 hypothetical protein CH271_10575 [Rhodococcus sp. 05-340-2]OZD80070.1 hypothetical protein CH272_10115 [Rhodococcus sp. 05-340-1]